MISRPGIKPPEARRSDRIEPSVGPAAAIVPMGILLVTGLGYLDFAEMGGAAIEWAYVAPAALVSWLASRGEGMLIAVTAGIVNLSVHLLLAGNQPSSAAGETVFYFACYVVTVLLVSHIKTVAFGAALQANPDRPHGMSSSQEFLSEAQREISRSGGGCQPVTIVYLDIDNFKDVNRRLGYAAASAFLRWVAQTIIQEMRGAYLLARLDGDEFAALLLGADADAARETVARIREALARQPGHADAPVTFTIGVVTYRRAPHSVREMIHAAQNLVCALKQDRINAVSYQVVGE